MSIFIGSTGGTVIFFRSPGMEEWEPPGPDGWLEERKQLTNRALNYLTKQPIITLDVLRLQLVKVGPLPTDVRATIETYPFSSHPIKKMVVHDFSWATWVGWLSAQTQKNVIGSYLQVVTALESKGAEEVPTDGLPTNLVQVVGPEALDAIEEAKRKVSGG